VASSTSTDSVPGTPATGSLVLRVPVAAFATLVADTRHAGTATSVTTSGQDVTAQYVDLQARIDALTTARKQYEQILAKAETIGDILSVEDELSDVQTQIEQLQGQLDVLEDQATYSTLTVHLTEPAPAPPPPVHHATQSGLTKAWDHARSTFTNGLESVVAALGGIAVFVVTVGTLGALAWGAWVIGRRRLL
jgi:chaperonin cofactor prefoldin